MNDNDFYVPPKEKPNIVSQLRQAKVVRKDLRLGSIIILLSVLVDQIFLLTVFFPNMKKIELFLHVISLLLSVRFIPIMHNFMLRRIGLHSVGFILTLIVAIDSVYLGIDQLPSAAGYQYIVNSLSLITGLIGSFLMICFGKILLDSECSFPHLKCFAKMEIAVAVVIAIMQLMHAFDTYPQAFSLLLVAGGWMLNIGVSIQLFRVFRVGMDEYN